MKKPSKTSKARAAGQSPALGLSHGWPIPCEWDKYIPPQPIITEDRTARLDDGTAIGPECKGPTWNKQWLLGLERFIREIVADEMGKANTVHEPQARQKTL